MVLDVGILALVFGVTVLTVAVWITHRDMEKLRRDFRTLEHFPIRLAIPRVCKESFAFFFGSLSEKRSDRFPKRLNSTRLHFA